MLKKFRQILNGEGRRHRHCRDKNCEFRGICRDASKLNVGKDAVPLSEITTGNAVRVFANTNIKTMEMGIYPGNVVTVLHNEPSDRNIIVKIHDQRYIIPKEIASGISVIDRDTKQ